MSWPIPIIASCLHRRQVRASRLAGYAGALVFSVCSAGAWSGEVCTTQSGVQILRQQLMPSSPVYYKACGLPAASVLAGQVAVIDGDDGVGSSTCTDRVCLFNARNGRLVRTWSLSDKPPGITLDAHVTPLIRTLQRGDFRTMKPMPSRTTAEGDQLWLGDLRIDIQTRQSGAMAIASVAGRPAGRHRFKMRTMRCEQVPLARSIGPGQVRAWALEGFAAVLLAAHYRGDEPGCSWTEWAVHPLWIPNNPNS